MNYSGLHLLRNKDRYKQTIYDLILGLIYYTVLHFKIENERYYQLLGLPEINNDNIDSENHLQNFELRSRQIVREDNFKKLKIYCDAIKKYISYKKHYGALPPDISIDILKNRDFYYSIFVMFVSKLIIDDIRPYIKQDNTFNQYVMELLNFEGPRDLKRDIPLEKKEMFAHCDMFVADFCKLFRERFSSIDFSHPSQETQDSREREYANLVEYFNTLHTAGPLLRNKPISTGLRRNIPGGKRSVVSKIHRPRRKYAKSKSAKQNRSKSLRRHRRRTSRK